MPCGGLYPAKSDRPIPAEHCFACGGQDYDYSPDHFVEEWDAYIHGKCVKKWLKNQEGQIVLDHGHEVVTLIDGVTTIIQQEDG